MVNEGDVEDEEREDRVNGEGATGGEVKREEYCECSVAVSRGGAIDTLLTMEQRQAETEQVVKFGLKSFHELGERARKTEAEVQVYREALEALATCEGVEVPVFVGEGRELDVKQLQEWLGRVLSGPWAVGEQKRRRLRGEGLTR